MINSSSNRNAKSQIRDYLLQEGNEWTNLSVLKQFTNKQFLDLLVDEGYLEKRSTAEWDELRYRLANENCPPEYLYFFVGYIYKFPNSQSHSNGGFPYRGTKYPTMKELKDIALGVALKEEGVPKGGEIAITSYGSLVEEQALAIDTFREK